MSESNTNVSWKQDLAAKRAQLEDLQAKIRGRRKALDAGRVDSKDWDALEADVKAAEALESSDEFRKLKDREDVEKRAQRFLADSEPHRQTEPAPTADQKAAEQRANAAGDLPTKDEYRKAFSEYLARGEFHMSNEARAVLTKGWQDGEKRANYTASGAAGGYLVPSSVENALDVATRDFIGPEALGADIQTVGGTNDRLIRVRDSSTRKARWVGEQVSDSAEATLSYGQKELKFYKMTTDYFYASRELLMSSDIDVEADFAQQMADEFAYAAAETLMIGDGVGKPEGLLTALSRTGATVDTATTATLVADDFLAAMAAVSDRVKMTGTFGFNPGLAVGTIMKMKGSGNLYLFRNQVTGEILPSIHGRPWKAVTFMPNTPTTSATIAAVYGRFNAYKVRYLRGGTIIRRFDQTTQAANTDSIGFKGFRDCAAGWCTPSGNSGTREAVALVIKS